MKTGKQQLIAGVCSKSKVSGYASRATYRNRTSIIIAHRLSTIQHVDHIIVLHKGQIREMGTYAELLALSGIYNRLYTRLPLEERLQ